MLRAEPRLIGRVLFSALGLVPLACGGAATNGDSGGNSQGARAGIGGATAGGGKSTSGGRVGSGGSNSSGGSSSSGGSTSSGGEARGGSGTSFPCADPAPAGGANTGYEQCGPNGPLHRPTIETCRSSLPRPSLPDPSEFDQCTKDADCTEMAHGYCGYGFGGGAVPGASCVYGCVEDAECAPDQICVCGEPVGHCSAAACSSDADCEAGFRCQSYASGTACGSQHFACQTADDTCGSDADCADAKCDADSGYFECVRPSCAVGRPFLVEGIERTAPVVERHDWCAIDFSLDISSLSSEIRQLAAQAWARIGQMEHASVAAFARFALQLLQLGAPPGLIERATQAMADETRHAKLAFAVASRVAGRAYGPGPLDIDRSLHETELTEVVRLTLREGCIGETVAALEAREAAEHAALPELQEVLRRIADDEARHAELAWRFVRWALAQQPQRVAEVVRQELARAQREAEPPARPHSAEELSLLGLGVVPEGLRRELRQAALREVIEPCGAALLAQAAESSPEYRVLSA